MGDALVSALVRDVVRKLTSLAIQEFGLLRSLQKDVLSLTDDFHKIQAVLQDAEEKHVTEKVVELWLKSLRSTSLHVENVLDEVLAEAMLRRLHKERGIVYKVRAFFSSNHNRLMVRTRLAHKVKTIRRKLDAIAAKRFDLKLTPGGIASIDEGVGGEMPNRETSSLIHSSVIYGRNEEMEMVIEKICNNDSTSKHVDNIRVYAIWGMGGLGKTTLAQLVYNHERVDKHFELKCWMYVSKKFQVKELIKGIIESIDKSECRISLLDAMQKDLQEKLRGKRFLIILDDVWIEDNEREKWEALSKTLSCGVEGSIVVMTTRSRITSRMMAKVPELQHELGCLSKDDSWSLFQKLAFAEGREGGDIKELEPIGKKIVEKCKGLPLAVKTLGGLMWSKSSTSDWENVMCSDIWELQENNILPALKLSYDNLLPHIKRCFAYCCLFPKGYEMEKDVLIPSWMANGLIPSREEADLYMLGEEIINGLVWKSFFQVVKDDERSYLGDRYKMHDLLHDLARYVMRHDCSVIEPDKELITPREVLHLSSSCTDFVFSTQDLEKLRSLRSIFILKAYDYEGNISHIFDLVYLRVLYMDGIRLRTLPKSIGELKYLKYLNLSWSKIEVLPESITYLQNLQVLLLKSCENLVKLPKGMRYMTNLQRLDISSCYSLLYLPVGIKNLTHLRILPIFPLTKKNGARIGELSDLNLLEGDMLITGLENVEGLMEAKNANLKYKRNMLVLYLHWGHWHTDETKPETNAREEQVLEGLEPNPSLKELDISSCKGRIFHMSWIDNLKNLGKIRFHACTNCEQIPPLGKLPSLRVIEMYWMDSLKFFNDDEHTTSGDNIMFPALQELDIQNCWKLVSLPHYFPKLEVLSLMDCHELASLPSNLPKLKKLHIRDCKSLHSLPDEIQTFKDLSKLEIWECDNLRKRYKEETSVDWLKISHIPSISFEAPRKNPRSYRRTSIFSSL